MRCSRIREAVSARMDGEAPGVPDGRVEAHLTTCDACREWAAAAASLSTALAEGPAAGAPDPARPTPDPGVVAALLAEAGAAVAAGAGHRSGRRPVLTSVGELRLALAALAVVQLVTAWPGVLPVGHAAAHMSHELTTWDFGLAVGFLFVAWQPSRAWGALPVVGLLVTGLAAMSVVDLVSGHPLLGREALHLLAVAGLGCQWLLARRVPRPSVVVRLA